MLTISPRKRHGAPAGAATLSIQQRLRQALPLVFGCKDYQVEQTLLARIDQTLRESGVEGTFLRICRDRFEARARKARAHGRRAQSGGGALDRHLYHSLCALRCTVLKTLIGAGYRETSRQLAHSPLYRWFCALEDFDAVRVPGKSTLRDYAHWLPAAEMKDVLNSLAEAVADRARARRIGLETELDMTVAWVDSTCLAANIHFPTDWVLMRDGVRTLIKSILTIRRHGLRRRIPEPEELLARINALAMGMAAAARRAGGQSPRKHILRSIKRVSKVVEEHGRRYRDALDTHWAETDLTRPEAEVILRRIDNVLHQMPEARRQAHERIIGGRQVPNADKILSLYERDVHVVVRGKAGAEVEFGNSLLLAESGDGFILDHELRQGASPGDARWLLERYAHIRQASGERLCGMVGDRGFDSAATRRLLDAEEVYDGLCPRDPARRAARVRDDEVFCLAMCRRAQTEGRIAILKNVFLGGVPRAKGFTNRQLQVAWAVLTHNLWLTARLPWARRRKPALAA